MNIRIEIEDDAGNQVFRCEKNLIESAVDELYRFGRTLET